MKTLIFFRHGKSDWDADLGEDHERPLAKRGRKAARLMGQWLKEVGQVPDHIVCSSAVRARETLDEARKAGGWRAPERVTENLYLSTPEAVLRELQAEPDETACLLLVGHEPTWSETVGRLIGSAGVRFPTAAMARVDVDAEAWARVEFGKGQLVWLVPPKLFP